MKDIYVTQMLIGDVHERRMDEDGRCVCFDEDVICHCRSCQEVSFAYYEIGGRD